MKDHKYVVHHASPRPGRGSKKPVAGIRPCTRCGDPTANGGKVCTPCLNSPLGMVRASKRTE